MVVTGLVEKKSG